MCHICVIAIYLLNLSKNKKIYLFNIKNKKNVSWIIVDIVTVFQLRNNIMNRVKNLPSKKPIFVSIFVLKYFADGNTLLNVSDNASMYICFSFDLIKDTLVNISELVSKKGPKI